MTTAKRLHSCGLRNCDGTQMGHDLAVQFPMETQKFKDAMDRHREPDSHYKIEIEYCTERAAKGTGEGVCDAALDIHGQCPYAGSHL